MTGPGEGRPRWTRLAAQAAPALLVAWLPAAALSTGAAEILLGTAVAAALLARAAGPQPQSWPFGWRSLLTGGASTGLAPWLWLTFAALFVISVPAGVDPHLSAGKLPKLFRYLLFFLPLAIPWRPGHWRATFWLQVPFVLALAALGAASLHAGHSRAQTYNMHYNTLAQIAAMSSLFLLAAAIYGPSGPRWQRAGLIAGSVIAAGVMVITQSRAAWLAWWLAAMALVLFRLRRRAALAITAVLVLVPLVSLPLVRASRPDLFDLRNPEFTRRYDLWRMALAAIRDHPLTGLGPGGLDVVYDRYKTGVLVDDPQIWSHVHNDLLGAALNHGIPAAAIWAALVGICYVTVVRRLLSFHDRAGSWLRAGFAATGASLHLFYMFGIVHENHPIYVKSCTLLLLWGLLVALDRDLDREPGREPGRGPDRAPGRAGAPSG